MPGTDRRNSTSSEDSNVSSARQVSENSLDATENIPTRVAKVTPPKPATNPLQFIKVGPCDLYKAAQEQIKKVEEIKKVEKKSRDEAEDWQSNLDNWKCSRRKRQEHIIERVVEVKKLELEEHDRNRKRSKTFSEMMEERTLKGGVRKMSLLAYPDGDSNDLSDLGLGQPSEQTNTENDNIDNLEYHSENGNGLNGSNGHHEDEQEATTKESEEYTYERAIQGYKSFAETKVKNVNERNGRSKISPPKKETGAKIGKKVSQFEQIRLRSESMTELTDVNKNLSKVDVNKRRSMFECNEVVEVNKGSETKVKEVKGSIKERLTKLEKRENETVVKKTVEDVSTTIKDRLSSLEKNVVSETPKKQIETEINNVSIKERLNNLEELKKEINSVSSEAVLETDVNFKEKLNIFEEKQGRIEMSDDEEAVSASFELKVKDFVNQSELTLSNTVMVAHVPNEPGPHPEITIQTCDNLFPEPEIQTNSDPLTDSEREILSDVTYVPKIESEIINVPKILVPEPNEQVTELVSESNEQVTELVSEPNEHVTELVSEPNEQVNGLVQEPNGPLVTISPVDCKPQPLPRTLNEPVNPKIPLNDVGEVGFALVDEPGASQITEIVTEDPETTETPDLEIKEKPSKPKSTSEFETALSEPVTVIDEPSPTHSSNPETCTDQTCPIPQSETLPNCSTPDESVNTKVHDCSDTKRTRKLTPMVLPAPLVQISSPKCELQIIEEGDVVKIEEDGEELCDVAAEDAKPDLEEHSTSLYTDENIDEVLNDDDEEEHVNKPEQVEVNLKPETIPDTVVKPRPPEYENVVITNQVPQVNNFSGNVEIVASLSFPLTSPSPIQPPKEKPPPPPVDEDVGEGVVEETSPELPPKPSLRRIDSTKRIKKEIRKKRSDFLGIEGLNDDCYLEPDINVAPPPDMISFLQEERRLEQQLYRQSICSESDSNHETAESRDSGVELDRGHVDDICWSKQPLSPDVLSENHSRQNSETFGNTSITSEEDEITKKEREIMEVLEKEEQWRYGAGTGNSNLLESRDLGEKLAVKLHQLEQEKLQLEWERSEEQNRRLAEEAARREDEERLRTKEYQLKEQENLTNGDADNHEEKIRADRERLQKEQELLERCRRELLEKQKTEQEIRNIQQWDVPSSRHSLQDMPHGILPKQPLQQQTNTRMNTNYRYSMPDLQQRGPVKPPPPVPPAKPNRIWENRIPSVDNIPQHVETVGGTQQMTRTTLQALSAAPRSRIISNENWIQAKRRPEAQKTSYNYQHWLIQEAEHRRITEQRQKTSQQQQQRRSLPAHHHQQSLPSHHTVGLPLSPPPTSHVHPAAPNNKWTTQQEPKPIPDSIIHTLTQRVQHKARTTGVPDTKIIQHRRPLESPNRDLQNKTPTQKNTPPLSTPSPTTTTSGEEKMLSVSGKKKCSHCSEELGRGAAMIIESLRLFYHINCFKCCVCHIQLGDGLMGTDVRVRNNKLHCHNCYSSDDGVKFSCV